MIIGQAAKSRAAHENTIMCSKSLACVAIDFLRDSEFRQDVRNYFNRREGAK